MGPTLECMVTQTFNADGNDQSGIIRVVLVHDCELMEFVLIKHRIMLFNHDQLAHSSLKFMCCIDITTLRQEINNDNDTNIRGINTRQYLGVLFDGIS